MAIFRCISANSVPGTQPACMPRLCDSAIRTEDGGRRTEERGDVCEGEQSRRTAPEVEEEETKKKKEENEVVKPHNEPAAEY